MINVRKLLWKKENSKGIFKMNFSKILLVSILFSIGASAQTEKNVSQQSLLWTRYNNQLELNAKWSINTEFDNRVFLKPVEENMYVIRTQLRNKITDKVEVGAGGAYFSVNNQEPTIVNGFHIPEYRLQQDVTIKQSLGKVNFSHRYLIEERFIQKATSVGLESGTSFYLRYRYRIQADYTIWKNKNQFLKTVVYDEIMINGGDKIIKNTFDQNRIYAAIQYGVSPSVAFELGYLNSYQQRPSGVDYFNRDIIRFSIFHKLKLKNKKI
jgi:hypothetical protein